MAVATFRSWKRSVRLQKIVFLGPVRHQRGLVPHVVSSITFLHALSRLSGVSPFSLNCIPWRLASRRFGTLALGSSQMAVLPKELCSRSTVVSSSGTLKLKSVVGRFHSFIVHHSSQPEPTSMISAAPLCFQVTELDPRREFINISRASSSCMLTWIRDRLAGCQESGSPSVIWLVALPTQHSRRMTVMQSIFASRVVQGTTYQRWRMLPASACFCVQPGTSTTAKRFWFGTAGNMCVNCFRDLP